MQNKRFFVVAFLLLALVAVVGTAAAVKNGEPDGNGHPYVGLMIGYDGSNQPVLQCSGTLLSPTIFLTSGHCIAPPAVKAKVWFESDVGSCIDATGHPTGPCSPIDGTLQLHPNYDPADFSRHDLGVVVLDTAQTLSTYGALPEEGVLDQAGKKRGQKEMTFTTVGYGVEQIRPEVIIYFERRVATPRLIQINNAYTGDYSMILSSNASTGGACLGDSGGPNFIGDSNVIGGVTSFSKNKNCGGTSGVYRLDTADDLNWLESRFGITPP